MRRLVCLLSAVFAVLVVGPIAVMAQLPTPGPIGGLTALPRTDPSTWPDQIVDGGFETTPLAAQGGPWIPASGFEAAWSWDNTGTNAHTGKGSMKMTGVAGAEAYEVFFLPAGSYTFTGYIKTGSGGTGRARLMVDLRRSRYESVPSGCTADCGINSWYTSQEISSGTNWTQVSVTFTISEADVSASKPSVPGKIKSFAVLDGFWAGARLTAWYDDVRLLQQPSFPLDVFMRYPNYRGMLFGDQAQTLSFHLTPLANYATGGYSVHATLRNEATGGELEVSDTPLTNLTVAADTGKPGIDVTLNVANALAAVGDYQPVIAEFKLVDAAGAEITPRYPTYRVYKVPASAKAMMNVSFNAQNQIVLGVPRPNNAAQTGLMPAAPRFTLGVYDSGLGTVDASTNWEQLLFDPTGARRMNGLPINVYLNYHLGDTGADVINNLITALTDHKAVYLQTGNCFSSTPANAHNAPTGFKIDQPGADGSYPYITQPPPTGIGQAVGGYYTADECTADMIDGVFSQYQRLVQRDPDSMTFAALLGTNDLPMWRDSVDVISTDPYPLYGSEPAGGYNHGQVAQWTRMTAQAVQHSRPIMTVLQFFKFDAARNNPGRWPTPKEMRNHAFMAIVEGARGLMWWSLGENGLTTACGNPRTWCAERTQHMNDLKAVVSDIAALEPILLKADVTAWGGSVSSVAENTTPPTTLPASAIRTLVKHDDTTGQDYLFAYNTTPYYDAGVASPSVTAQVSLPASASSIAVYGENRTIGGGASFTDTFGPFEAHVYVISY